MFIYLLVYFIYIHHHPPALLLGHLGCVQCLLFPFVIRGCILGRFFHSNIWLFYNIFVEKQYTENALEPVKPLWLSISVALCGADTRGAVMTLAVLTEVERSMRARCAVRQVCPDTLTLGHRLIRVITRITYHNL